MMVSKSPSHSVRILPVFSGSTSMPKRRLDETTKGNDCEFVEDDRWGDFENYMTAKKRKLTAQFQDAANHISPTCEETVSTIFRGISIYVNGSTDPTADELKRLMMLHGGVYSNTKKTTHIIASNLPYTKIVKLTADDKVVKPEWITDSIKQNRLLPWKKYELYPRSTGGACKTPQELDKNDQENLISGSKENIWNGNLPQPVAHKAGDPNYLGQFFSRSRLHHLSLWKTESKKLVHQLQEKHSGEFPLRKQLKECCSESTKTDFGTVIMHIDFDCFFVSVGLLSRPHLSGKPVAVCHGRTGRGQLNQDEEETVFNSRSEVSSCSYAARKAGVKNGMYLGPAKQLCPELEMIPYEFERYKKISTIFYETVADVTLDIEAISCDEMFVDCTEVIRATQSTPLEFAAFLREEVRRRTGGCNASVGLGANPLLARLATKKAKPNGQFYIEPDNILTFLSAVHVSDVPGAGYSAKEKFARLNVQTCGDLQRISLSVLQKEFGSKNGLKFYNYARGVDDHSIRNTCVRKSVSVDINYGIRMTTNNEFHRFFNELSTEVEKRMRAARVLGHTVTLKLLVRHPSAPIEPQKYMGCGHCNAMNKSVSLIQATDSARIVAREGINLFNKMNVDVKELRGIGVQITRLIENSKSVPVALNGKGVKITSIESSKRQIFELNTSDLNEGELKHEDVTSCVQEKKSGSSMIGMKKLVGENDELGDASDDDFDFDNEMDDWLEDETQIPTLLNARSVSGQKNCTPSGYDLISEIGWQSVFRKVSRDLMPFLQKWNSILPLKLRHSVSQSAVPNPLETIWSHCLPSGLQVQTTSFLENRGSQAEAVVLDKVGNVVFNRMCEDVEYRFWLNRFGVAENYNMVEFASDFYGATLRYLDTPRVIRVLDPGTKVVKPRVIWARWNLNSHYREEYLNYLFDDCQSDENTQQGLLDLCHITASQAHVQRHKELKVRAVSEKTNGNNMILPALSFSQVDPRVLKEIPAEYLTEWMNVWNKSRPETAAKDLIGTRKGKSSIPTKTKRKKPKSEKAQLSSSQSLLDRFMKIGRKSQQGTELSRTKRSPWKSVEKPVLEDDDDFIIVSASLVKDQRKTPTKKVKTTDKKQFPTIIFGKSSITDVQNILAWHIVNTEPDPELLGSILTYAEELVSQGRLSQLDLLVKTFYREAHASERKTRENWILSYSNTIQIIQSSVKMKFSSTLLVPSF